MARTARAELAGERLTLHNVRNNRYGPPGTPFETVWETRTYDLDTLKRLWFVVEPFMPSAPVVAHNLVSFEFANDFLAFSAEARIEAGGQYSIWRGLVGGFELAYTFGDEQDFLGRRTTYQDHHVYLYPLTLPPDCARAFLLAVLRRANALAERSERYNSAFDNCTSVLARHANEVRPGSFPPFHPAQVMPGNSDKVLFEKGWIATDLPWEAVRPAFDIKDRAQAHGNAPGFSAAIRRGLGGAD
jgi:hypothetical protein